MDSAPVRQAARVVAGSGGGRPAQDDAPALDEAAKLVETGISVHRACGVVARRVAKLETASVESIRRRLKRKFHHR
jgi:hypothetical protein